MIIQYTKHLGAAVALVFAGSVCAQVTEAPVAVNVSGLPPHVAKKVEEKASKGMTALRLYVNRTRMIHELYLGSLLR